MAARSPEGTFLAYLCSVPFSSPMQINDWSARCFQATTTPWGGQFDRPILSLLEFGVVELRRLREVVLVRVNVRLPGAVVIG